MTYDQNGLELSPIAECKNAYLRTTVDLTAKKFTAYAYAKATRTGEWTMYTFARFDDARDAAFVAQEFQKKYPPEVCRQMVTDGTLLETGRQFAADLEIPEWKYPAEGFTIEEHLNGGYSDGMKNYVDNARDAMREALKAAHKKAPKLSMVSAILSKIEMIKMEQNVTYRIAAQQVTLTL